MRITVLLVAGLLSVLAFLPCQDLFGSTPANPDCALVDNDGTPDHHDDCTPLCVCSCCGVLVDAPSPPLAVESYHLLPPPGQTRPEFIPEWKTIDGTNTDLQPPRA